MALEPERRVELIAELLEASDGTRADDYATIRAEFEEMQGDIDKYNLQIKKLEDQNTQLKRENFRLFERSAAKQLPPEPEPEPPVDEERKDYLSDFMDKNGFFK